jgi:hypothetical protein
MDTIRSAPVRIALVLAAALSLDCVRVTGPMRIPLRWAPTDDLRLPAEAADALGSQAINVGSFVDVRAERGSIGKNIEARIGAKDKDVWLVSTPDDVAAFLAGRFREVLKANGIATVSSGSKRIIKAEVQRYYVTEGGTYEAEVVLRFTVEDRAGRKLWQGIGQGHANRWGRSYSEENYQQSLCNAFLEATKDLMRREKFLDAFRS